MSDVAPLTESDLPCDPEVFADRVIAEVDAFVDQHHLGAPRFSTQLTEEEMREGLYKRVFNEILAADIPRDMLNEADIFDDPQLFVHLLKQVEDEAKHARMLAQRLWNLGGDPQESLDRIDRSPLHEGYEELSILEQCATLQAAGERMAKTRHPNELKYYDDETADIYENVIVPEEQFHAKIGENILRKCTTEEQQREMLQRIREVKDLLLEHNERDGDAYADRSEAAE